MRLSLLFDGSGFAAVNPTASAVNNSNNSQYKRSPREIQRERQRKGEREKERDGRYRRIARERERERERGRRTDR